MKIKQTRQVRLDELVDYIWKNNIKSKGYSVKMLDKEVRVFEDGRIETYAGISEKDLFTITEEVEITEEMELKQLVVIYENGGSGKIRNMNIKELVERHESVYGHGVPIKFIYLQNEDGSIGELIWDKERGLID